MGPSLTAARALHHWLTAVRPKTLSVAVVPVLAGSALAWADVGTLVWPVMLAALTGAVLIQVGTNLHNDAADFERGADEPATRLGPVRVCAAGLLPPTLVKRAAHLSFGLAALIGVYLSWIGGWPILLAGVLSIIAGLAYTGGPRPIAYGALGELFVLFFFGLVAVAGSHYLQTGTLSVPALVLGVVLGMPAAAVLVVNNYRDIDNDRRVGRRTLAVRLGRRASRVEYALLLLLPFLLLLPLGLMSPKAAWLVLPLLSLPWALVLVARLQGESDGPGLNRLLAGTARLQLLFGLLLSAALVAPRLAGGGLS